MHHLKFSNWVIVQFFDGFYWYIYGISLCSWKYISNMYIWREFCDLLWDLRNLRRARHWLKPLFFRKDTFIGPWHPLIGNSDTIMDSALLALFFWRDHNCSWSRSTLICFTLSLKSCKRWNKDLFLFYSRKAFFTGDSYII